jgi:hypothetical protein
VESNNSNRKGNNPFEQSLSPEFSPWNEVHSPFDNNQSPWNPFVTSEEANPHPSPNNLNEFIDLQQEPHTNQPSSSGMNTAKVLPTAKPALLPSESRDLSDKGLARKKEKALPRQ